LKSQTHSISSGERSARLKLYRLTEQDGRALASVARLVDRNMAVFVDDFYDHLERYPEAIEIIRQAGSSIEQLKRTNPDYLREIFRGKFDEQYFASRERIGAVHARIGLSPRWFFAGMASYAETLGPLLVRKLWLSPRKQARTLAAFLKAINLDQALIMEAYVEYGFISEVHKVVNSGEEVAGRVGDNTARVREATDFADRGVRELAHVTEQLSMAATTQAMSTQAVAERMNNLAHESTMVTAAVTQQQASLTQVNALTVQVFDLLNEINENASIWETLQQRVGVIDKVRETVSATANEVTTMVEQAATITKFLSTIQDIAAETNLLALNAAIEAARAGEHGRGFAVVADEVRKLAENAARATADITELVAKVSEVSQTSKQAMESTLSDVDAVAEVATSASNGLALIAKGVQVAQQNSGELRQAMADVQAASEQTVETVNRIGENVRDAMMEVEQVAAVAEENSASAQEMGATAQQISAQVEQLAHAVGELDSQVGDLRELMAQAEETVSRGRAA
jgi:heam-based aerotactic trancducer